MPLYEVDLWPGKPYPLGSTWDGEGVNFALFAERATGVELCLFELGGGGRRECARANDGADRLRMARLRAGIAAGAVIWVPGRGAVRAGKRQQI